jgi:glycosyltransferase involved in cell wall biosynthesis
VPKKGFDLLLKALPEVLRQNACTQLLLIGDGPERSALEKLAKSLHLDNSVQFLGERTHEAAMRIMSEASLVAIPSREEPFGLVALEAMFLGKPVVATEVGGLPEVLNGADALLVSPDDAGALANSIIAMINKEEIDPTFGAHNRRIAERFSMAAMTDKYLSLYQSLCVPDLTVDGGRTTEKT